MHWLQVFWPTGRVNRASYWALAFVSNGLANVFERTIPKDEIEALLVTHLIVSLICGYINICLFIGRLHDIDHSGWWSLPIMLPALVIVTVVTTPYVLAGNKLTLELQEYAYPAFAVFLVCAAAALYVGLKRGTQGHNRFGPAQPLAKPNPP